MKKSYSSYVEIDRDLEILKVSKELDYNKLVYSLQKAKEEILPPSNSLLSNAFSIYKSATSGSTGTILKVIVPTLIGWYLKRKRGL
jgi:hypothetical protein